MFTTLYPLPFLSHHIDAVDYLSSLSLNGTPEVVPVPRNQSTACSLDSGLSSRKKRAALDNGEDDAAAASSSPAAIDRYEGCVGDRPRACMCISIFLNLHDDCRGCGGVGGGAVTTSIMTMRCRYWLILRT